MSSTLNHHVAQAIEADRNRHAALHGYRPRPTRPPDRPRRAAAPAARALAKVAVKLDREAARKAIAT